MRILVVEDEQKTATNLKKGLVENGFQVDLASEGNDGFFLARTGGYDAVILDVMLPGRDGWEILAELRRAGDITPVIFLTARDAVEDRIKGLESGADDYLVKPFAFLELVARIRSILRRGPGRAIDMLRVGDLEVDLVRQKASRAGTPLELTSKQFLLLTVLARRTGEVLPRNYIAEQVWGVTYEARCKMVDVQVQRLRARVDEPFPTKLIHTVWGIGYILEDRDAARGTGG